MENLPIELWHSIFDRLELPELPSCAQVSKKLYFAVKAYRVRELAFDRPAKTHWFHPHLSIYGHRVRYSMVSVLSRSSFNLGHLKRLKIGSKSSIDDLNEINKFTRLEELDIDLKNYTNERTKILCLAHLRVLFVFASDHLPYLDLDTPRLEKLHTFSLKKLNFVHPDSVRCIQTFFHNEKLPIFRNLESLLFTDRYNKLDFYGYYDSKSFKEFSLTNLKKLKEIDFFYHFERFEQNNMSNFKKIIGNILELKRPDLRLFWMSVQVTDVNLMTEYQDWMETIHSFMTFQLQRYEKLKDKIENLEYHTFKFNSLMKKLTRAGFDPKNEDFLSKLFAKISFTKIAVVDKVDEPDFLMEFIVRLPSLISLRFENSGLDQAFFDCLAGILRLNGSSLRFLSVKRCDVLDLEFLLKFLHLEYFECDQELPTELLPELLRHPSLTKIEFSSRECEIERISANRFRLNGEPLSLTEILKHFEPYSTPPDSPINRTAQTGSKQEASNCSLV